MPSPSRVLVLGVGNLLMGDEGVGVDAIYALQRQPLPDGVELLDGGTGGFHLLSYLREHPRVVLIDATMDGKDPGTVSVTRPKFLSDYPRSLGAHDVGLRDLLESASLLGPLPDIDLVTVSIQKIRPATTELSPPVLAALPRVVDTVQNLLSQAPPTVDDPGHSHLTTRSNNRD